MQIKKLDSQTTNQIAAGEVVENPASVIKELVENALDAGSSRIKISIKQGGLEKITVTDNGWGIPSGELRMALQRHATSKIDTFEDLQAVNSLGFRGEALPSIASVSRLSITTRHEKETVGSYIFSDGGTETLFKETGFPQGARVTVKNLFFNTPVRKKFLKSVSAETAQATKLVQNLALSRPDVAFSLDRNQKTVLQTPGDSNILNAILSIYGNDLGQQLVPLEAHLGEYALVGYLSHPGHSRNNRNYQLFFVNQRYVKSSLIREELDRVFASFVTSKRFPVAFLYFILPPGETDVNVHPTKTEIRFHHEPEIRQFIKQALKDHFSTSARPGWKNAGFQASIHAGWEVDKKREEGGGGKEKKQEQQEQIEQVKQQKQEFQAHTLNTLPTPSPQQKGQDRDEQVREAQQVQEDKKNYQAGDLNDTEQEQVVHPAPPVESFFHYDLILGQLFNTYIMLQKKNSLLFIDQHAAHERIIWEKMLRTEDREQIKQSIIPLTLELSPAMTESALENLDLLSMMGLEMEQFGNNTFIIRTVPVFIKDIVTGELLQDILESVLLNEYRKDNKVVQKELLIKVSCKGSIKANQKLSFEEMESLVQQLKNCQEPFFCPHGRPVYYQIDKDEMEKQFHRRN